MASGALGDSRDDLNSRGRCRWTENSKVYTRKIRKKVSKNCNDNDAYTTTTVVAADLSTYEDPNNCGGRNTNPGSLANRTTEGHVVPECLGDVVKKDACSYQRLREHSPHQVQSPSCGSQDKHMPSIAEGNSPTPNLLREGSPTSELQNLEDSALLNSNEAQDLKNPPSLSSANKILQTSELRSRNMRESSLVSNENDLPNGREVDAAQLTTGNEAQNDGRISIQVRQGMGPMNVNGVVKPLVISSIDDRIKFKLCKTTPKNEIKELREKLEHELDQVRGLVKQLKVKELQLASYNTQISNSNISNSSNHISDGGAGTGVYSHPQPQHGRIHVVDRKVLVRVNSEVGAIPHQETGPMRLVRVNSDIGAARNLEQRPYSRQLSVAVMDNNHRASEFVEKEKRTPKANQYYRNSEFLLGKDRLPPESNKRLKTNNGRKHSREPDRGVGLGFQFDKRRNQVFKNCSSVLQRLMKHKHGWVFNEPVNVKTLGLADYHDIIKHPMDLGTIKTRLSQNWYKSPSEFAEDVRLVFRNAMTYNPKGHDVHIMAEQLLQIFEERWAIIETENNPHWKYPNYQDGGLHTPPSGMAPPQSHFASDSIPASAPVYAPAAPQMRTSDRPEPIQRPHVGRTSVPKKPKAKDPNKRDMTYDEKQRLSTNLQSLPAEKLDAIVQIIKKRNTAVSQHDDEIEVDIDIVDIETLWELDRFVTNYKKSLSKKKRKAELASKARLVTNENVALMNSTPADAHAQLNSGAAFQKGTARPTQGEKKVFSGSKSSTSSSSSSDSGSSSSDSDSDSSSADESDAGHSPRT